MKVSQTVPLLLVSDLEKSHAFYCEGLGFETAHEWKPDGVLSWCWLRQGDAAIMLQQSTDEDPPATTWGKGMTIYFVCGDANEAHQEFTARGVKASKPTETFYGMNQTFVTDPDGYKLCFENQTL